MRTQTIPVKIGVAGLAFALLAATASTGQADPVAWAPAQSFRISHEAPAFRTVNVVRPMDDDDDGSHPVTFASPPFSLAGGRCDREAMAGLVDGASAAPNGSRVASADGGHWAGLVDAFAVGVVVVGPIGSAMDRIDHACVGGILAGGADGQEIVWNNPQGDDFQLTPLTSLRGGDMICRDYQITGTISGKLERHYGRACRQPGGAWRRVAS